jgi:hypothetical protein
MCFLELLALFFKPSAFKVVSLVLNIILKFFGDFSLFDYIDKLTILWSFSGLQFIIACLAHSWKKYLEQLSLLDKNLYEKEVFTNHI